MAINLIGTYDHLRMAKSVLADLRNRGFEEHASLLFSGDENEMHWLDNIIIDTNGQNVDRGDLDAGVVQLAPLGMVASIGPVYGFITDASENSDGSLGEVCNDIGLQSEGTRLIEQWLEEGKYVLLINDMPEDQIDFMKKRLADWQGIDDLTIC